MHCAQALIDEWAHRCRSRVHWLPYRAATCPFCCWLQTTFAADAPILRLPTLAAGTCTVSTDKLANNTHSAVKGGPECHPDLSEDSQLACWAFWRRTADVMWRYISVCALDRSILRQSTPRSPSTKVQYHEARTIRRRVIDDTSYSWRLFRTGWSEDQSEGHAYKSLDTRNSLKDGCYVQPIAG